MRRGILYICFVMTLLSLTACSKGNESLIIREIEVNTLLIKEGGVIQSALVDEFDEPYYDKDELREFMDKEIDKYNGKNEEDSVVLVEYEVLDQMAKVILEYKNLDVYSEFNQIEAKWLTPEEARSSSEIPNLLTAVKEEGEVNKEDILKEDCKVLVLNESIDVRLDGKVIAFANGILLNDRSVQTGAMNASVIIYQ